MFEVEVPRPKEHKGAHVVIYLSLFFLLLAFFVALTSIATFEVEKTRAVLYSITTAFSDQNAASLRPDELAPLEGPILVPEEFHRTLANLVATVFPLASIEAMRPDRLVEITVPAEAVFFVDQARLRPEAEALLDGIADGLGRHPPGLRYTAEIVVGGARITSADVAQGEALGVDRAAALARDIVRRGAPRDVVAAGVAYADTGDVRMTFRRRPDDAPKVDLHQLVR